MRPEHWLYTIPLRLRSLFRWAQADQELDDELREHLERKTEEYVAQGMRQEEAYRRARLDLGGTEQTKAKCRDARRVNWIQDFVQDLRFGLRILRKSPGFTAAVVLTLALGIGATTAIFTLIDAVMLKSLPVANPKHLYRLGDNNNCCVMVGTQNGGSFVLYSHPLYEYLRDSTPEFSELAAFEPWTSDLSVRRNGSAAEPYKGEFVSANYFNTLGVRAFAGRLLAPPDDSASAPRVAVMNYHTWQQRFGLDPSVIGSAFNINGAPYTIAGVTPPQFYGDTLRSDPPDFWLPLVAEPNDWLLHNSMSEWLYLIGRLRPEVAPERAQARLTVELKQWLNSHPEVIPEHDRGDIAKQHVHLMPAPGGVGRMQTNYASGLRLLVTIAALVLLIACANVANLLLARGAADRPQNALRLALGAPRARLIRQKLTESILLAAAGGATGLYVAYAGTRTILLLAFRGAHYVPISPRPSLPVLGFAFLLSLITGLVFGVAPAWIGSRSDPADALHDTGRLTRDRSSLPRK